LAPETVNISTYTPEGLLYDTCSVQLAGVRAATITGISYSADPPIASGRQTTLTVSVPVIRTIYSLDRIRFSFANTHSPVLQMAAISGYSIYSGIQTDVTFTLKSQTALTFAVSTD